MGKLAIICSSFFKNHSPINQSQSSAFTNAKLKGQRLLIKYGGNAMIDDSLKDAVLATIVRLKNEGAIPIIVHGGGHAITQLLDEVQLQSEFVGGHRKTDAQSIRYIEMALSGEVNGDLVRRINRGGKAQAVGLSGYDGQLVTATKRMASTNASSDSESVDLGFVGDVDTINPTVIDGLLESNFIPVISPVSADTNGQAYNINADMLAGHLAGRLNATQYVAITNVDGLLRELGDPSSRIAHLTAAEARREMGGIINGGMIPKIESCLIALENGASAAHIVNGQKPDQLLKQLAGDNSSGTRITP